MTALGSEIAAAAQTALVDAAIASQQGFRPRFVSNDHRLGKKVLAVLEAELQACSSFDFSVAFVTRGGITPLLQTLRELEARGVPGRILTTDYLAFSEPAALEKLDSLMNIEVRMFVTNGAPNQFGFHTKGYLFTRPDGTQKVLMGSANLTGTALTVNREWNLAFTSLEQGELTCAVRAEFEELWAAAQSLSDQLAVYRQLVAEKRRALSAQRVTEFQQVTLQPNAMQLAFMKNLQAVLNDGAERALLISATGTGKTYASAFAMRHLNPGRVLFLAHREQVLRQSLASYRRVIGTGKTYGLLSGNAHDVDADYLFATMQTMAKPEVLSTFGPASFDCIVVDEVHRAASASYQKILAHFCPRFCLGMTASPDRLDGFDIYALFNNCIVYEIRLQQAMEHGLLCPFHYFGITDIAVDGVPIDDKSAFSHLVSDERVEHIINQAAYFGHGGSRVKGLVFCRNKAEGRALSERFNEHGFSTLFLSGDDSQNLRERAIERLEAEPADRAWGERLDYLFTVDIFNEGVDIPQVNQVIMLRPTESPVVFVQQLGRGLRKANGKEYVVILDFIGSYENNYLIPIALSGDRSYNKDGIRKYVMEADRVIPGSSSIHFDEISRSRIFASIDRSTVTSRMLREKYLVLRHKLGRIPHMVDFLDHGEIDPLLFVEKKKSYYRFLAENEAAWKGGLDETEQLALEFVSRYCANGMRPHELLVLRDVVANGGSSRAALARNLVAYGVQALDDASYASTRGVLDKSFVNTQSERESYSNFALVSFEGDAVAGCADFTDMLENARFKEALMDVLNFGLRRYCDKYRHNDDGFVLYEKYTRKDVCRLLNWPNDRSSTLYGYRVGFGTCPIFVTYNKSDGISESTQYADEFVDQRLFSWMTRSRLTLDSPEVQEIIHAQETGLDIRLFIKKSDNEGSDFYYFGKARPIDWAQTVQRGKNGGELPIVNFTLELEHTVQDDMYAYFTGPHAAPPVSVVA